MVRKVTYGKRPGGNDKRPLPYDIDSAIENDDSRKRSKTDDDELEKLRFPGRQAKKSSLLKKSLHSGPVSFSNDDGDIDPAPKKRTNVFDKVLKEGRYQAEMPDQSLIQIYQDRKRNSYLPTPPAEAQRKAHQQARRDATFSRSKGIASNGGPKTSNKPATPAQTSQLFERVIEDEQPKQAYKPKAYKADETAAPRKDITGDRLSSKSKEAEMWSMNQKDSPFLRLPGEVRNAIYEYALGGKTIHIDYETYRMTYKSNKIQTVTPVFKYHCTVYDKKPTNPFNAAAQPYRKSSTSFTPLNNVCRQLYQETAVLPYKLNLICFGSHNIMFNFLFMEKRLSRQQLDAFAQLMLPDELPGSNMLGLLRNLEKVYLAVDQGGKAKGWFVVVGQEGKKPKLQRKVLGQ